jgi:hypothetical protein
LATQKANRRSLDNGVSKFGKFTWGDSDQIRRAIQAYRDQIHPAPLPVRFKIKLGEEIREPDSEASEVHSGEPRLIGPEQLGAGTGDGPR